MANFEKLSTFVGNGELLNNLKNLVQGCDLEGITFEGIYKDEHDTLILHIHGGLNGKGEWKNYFGQLQELCNAIKGMWLVDIHVDCPDDVFDAYMGVPSDYLDEIFTK